MQWSQAHPGGVTSSRSAGAAVLRAFLPAVQAPPPPASLALHGPRPSLRCRTGLHTWLAPELSLRSARTGYSRGFCLHCTEERPISR